MLSSDASLDPQPVTLKDGTPGGHPPHPTG